MGYFIAGAVTMVIGIIVGALIMSAALTSNKDVSE